MSTLREGAGDDWASTPHTADGKKTHVLLLLGQLRLLAGRERVLLLLLLIKEVCVRWCGGEWCVVGGVGGTVRGEREGEEVGRALKSPRTYVVGLLRHFGKEESLRRARGNDDGRQRVSKSKRGPRDRSAALNWPRTMQFKNLKSRNLKQCVEIELYEVSSLEWVPVCTSACLSCLAEKER